MSSVLSATSALSALLALLRQNLPLSFSMVSSLLKKKVARFIFNYSSGLLSASGYFSMYANLTSTTVGLSAWLSPSTLR